MEVKKQVTELIYKCIVCCCSSENKNKYYGQCQFSSSSSKEVLNRFCESFLHISRLELEDNLLSVCFNCQSFLNSAMESKAKVDEIEEQVRELQMNILQKLREVQLHMDKVESKLKSVEESLLKGQSNGEPARAQSFRTYPSKRSTRKPPVDLEVIRFRSSIANAVKKLRSFRANTRKKFFHGECTVDMGPRGRLSSSNILENVVKQEASSENNQSTPEPENVFDDGDCESDIRDRLYAENTPPEECSEEVGNMINNEDSDNDNERMDKNSPNTKKRRRKTCPKVELNQTDLDLLTNEVEGFPIFPFNKVKLTEETSEFKKFALELLLQYSSPILKRNVAYVKEFQKKSAGMDHSSAEYLLLKFELERQIGIYFDYDTTSGSVHIKGFPITIDEDSNSIECSQCPKLSTKLEWPPSTTNESKRNSVKARKNLKKHLLRRHLSIYQCKVANCEDKTLYNSFHFPYHLKSHIGAANNNEKVPISPHHCEICGRPILIRQLIRQHLWTHKNAEEKQAAVAAGEVFPSVSSRFQCPTCGKEFRSKGVLTKHEKGVHTEVNETVLCPNCGKSVKKSYFHQHKQRACSSSTKVKCKFCDKTLKNQVILANHMKRMHRDYDPSSKERPFVCDICGNSFKWGNLLQIHIKRVHEQRKRFGCKKGCGAGFPTKWKLLRHEKGCKFQLLNS